jgi:hypothetical protein
MITLVEGDRGETYQDLSEAVEAAKTWYAELAGDKLPTWNYQIQTVNDLFGAIVEYKTRLAWALGYGADYELRLRLRLRAAKPFWGSITR